jgi:DNA-directed RNA polymerase alpha subunit
MQKKPILVSLQSSLKEENTNFYGKFYLGPFEIGQGLTLANALRRTLLSELKTFAITSIEIDGVTHEYSTIRGVKESVLDIVLNMKKIVLKKNRISSVGYFFDPGVAPFHPPLFNIKRGGYHEANQKSYPDIGYKNIKKVCRAYLQVEGPGIIRAKHILFPSFLQSVDPEQYIATLSEDGILNIKIQIREGKNFIVHNLKKSLEDKKSLSSPKLIGSNVNDLTEQNKQQQLFKRDIYSKNFVKTNSPFCIAKKGTNERSALKKIDHFKFPSCFYFVAFNNLKIQSPFTLFNSHLPFLLKIKKRVVDLTPEESSFKKYRGLFQVLQKKDGSSLKDIKKIEKNFQRGVHMLDGGSSLSTQSLYSEHYNRKKVYYKERLRVKEDALYIKAPKDLFHKVVLAKKNNQLKPIFLTGELPSYLRSKRDSFLTVKNSVTKKKVSLPYSFFFKNGETNLIKKDLFLEKNKKRFFKKYLSHLNLLVHQKTGVVPFNEIKKSNPFYTYGVLNQHNKIKQFKIKKTRSLRSETREVSSRSQLFLDPVFMPVNKVNFLLELDERLHPSPKEMVILEIWTNGSIMPNKALKKALNQLIRLCLTFKKAKMLNI